MAETQTPYRTNTDASLVSGFAKGATIAAALTWVLALLAYLTANPHGFEGLVPFLLLLVTTPFLLLVGVPILFLSYTRRR
jgi:hypothetical protein